jgi:Fe-S-cluster containining protein
MEYQERIDAAEEKKEDIAKLFKRLKKRRPKNLDDVFHELHDKAFEQIDCLKCANCCKTTSPIFRDVDIKRISKKMKVNVAEFEKIYLKKDEDNDWVLISAPCAFLGSDNFCSIYDFRPMACRDFPHTDRKKMSQILDLTLENTTICPAVAEIALEVTKEFE